MSRFSSHGIRRRSRQDFTQSEETSVSIELKTCYLNFNSLNLFFFFFNSISYEKMMSGMYMGEIVRLIILDLWEKELLFVGHRDHNWNTDYRQALYTKGSFYTKYVSEIETDSGVTYRHTKSVLEQMGLDRPTYDDCAIVQYVCKLVSRRAAQLAAAGNLSFSVIVFGVVFIF